MKPARTVLIPHIRFRGEHILAGLIKPFRIEHIHRMVHAERSDHVYTRFCDNAFCTEICTLQYMLACYKVSVHRNGVGNLGVGPDWGIRPYVLPLRSTEYEWAKLLPSAF